MEPDNFIVTYGQLRPLSPASEQQKLSVKNWFETYKCAIYKEEQEFTNKRDNVIALSSPERSPMLDFVDWHFPRLTSTLFPTSPNPDKVNSPNTLYDNKSALESFLAVLYLVVGLGLLFGPMWWLAFVSDTLKRLGIIIGFMAFFTLIVHKGSDIKPWEVIGAATA